MNILRILVVLFCSSVPLVADVVITRDSFGVPTISGGNLTEVSRAIGRLHAEDRLWQIFLQNIAANGRLTQYLGTSNPDFLKSDVFQRQINPTDEEVETEIQKFWTKKTLTAFENYVKGLNDWVDAVNNDISLRPLELLAVLGTDPIPHFTLNDNLRSVRLFFQSFSSTQIPQFQLSNLAALQTLATSFGSAEGYAIFSDVDPTSNQVRSLVTIMQNNNPTPRAAIPNLDRLLCKINKPKALVPFAGANFDINNNIPIEDLNAIAGDIRSIKELHKTMSASGGSNGQVIGPEKSASGYPLLRCAIQPNFNHPGDFYQVKVNSFFTGNFFIVPGTPFGIGLYNTFGFNAQTGHLPTNDFLFEPTSNVSSSRIEVIKILGQDDLPIEVYRSSSGGWVIANPVSISMPNTMLTLRSAFIERQLQGLNIIGDLPYLHSVPEFFRKTLSFNHSSDIIGFEGQCADCRGNFGAYQATDWTQLPNIYDRRLPQGVISLAPPNSVYNLRNSARKPMFDINNPQGYYSGWNNLFKQFAAGSADTVTGLPLSRAYWLVDYFKQFNKISLDDLKNTTFEQAVANSVVAFKDSRPTAFADLFNPLFKERFFQAFDNVTPTPTQQQALNLLANYDGRWFEGTKAQVVTTTDVSDEFILANAWLLNVAAAILNPFLDGTYFEIAPGTSGGAVNALPTLNSFNFSNDLATYQGNLLARILGTSSDNTLLFPGWLTSVNVDQVIRDSLDTAISNLGGFAAQPWGDGLRPIYLFKNAVLGPVANMLTFNSSGLYFVAEFRPEGITNVETVLPLGESGFVAPGPTFAPHNFDQLPYFTQFELIPN